MNLSQVSYIIAIANTGSLSGAARQLGISQSALSKYLMKVEEECRMELFTHEKKKLKPTKAGRVYLEAAYKIQGIRQQTFNSIQMLGQTSKRYLKIGVTPHQGAMIIAKLYPQFRQRFPQTEIVMKEGYTKELHKALMNGEVDYIITTPLNATKGVEMITIMEEEILMSIPVFHSLGALSSDDPAQAATLDLRELKDSPFVMMGEDSTIGAVTRKSLEDAGIDPIIVFESLNGFMVDEMIRAGVGVGFIPYRYAVPSKQVVYFKIKQHCSYSGGVMIRSGHVFTQEEKYLLYCQMKVLEGSAGIKSCRSEATQKIYDEFENESPIISENGGV